MLRPGTPYALRTFELLASLAADKWSAKAWTVASEGAAPAATIPRTNATSDGLFGLGSHRTLNISSWNCLATAFSAPPSGLAAAAAAAGAGGDVLAGSAECNSRRCCEPLTRSLPTQGSTRGLWDAKVNTSFPLEPGSLVRRNEAIVTAQGRSVLSLLLWPGEVSGLPKNCGIAVPPKCGASYSGSPPFCPLILLSPLLFSPPPSS